jgi:hypothetical protein
MSSIETGAKVSLEVLMAGDPFVIAAEHQRKLSRWAVLKSIVNEYDTHGTPAYSRAECEEFMRAKNQIIGGVCGLLDVNLIVGVRELCDSNRTFFWP